MDSVSSFGALRLSIFLGLLILLIFAETLLPRKARALPRLRRWGTNLAFVIVDSLVVRLMGPLIAVSAAIYAQTQGWGLLNAVLLPSWFELILAVCVLDLAIYAQHAAFHHVPLFWRFHKVHHTDRDIDVTTALRFHPVEIAVSMLYKSLIILCLGPTVIAVLIFEIVLNGMAMFNHANLRLPLWLDKFLRVLIVTPDMHRVHHSVEQGETNSNFGFNLSLWDRVFRTYKAQPDPGHDRVVIGLPEHQTPQPAEFFWSLRLPFNR